MLSKHTLPLQLSPPVSRPLPPAQAPTMAKAVGRLLNFMDPKHEAYDSLVTKGYAVVDCIPAEQADRLYHKLWDDIESLKTGVDRNNPSTWKDGWMQTTHGLVQNQGSGLWPSVCEARAAVEEFWMGLYGGRRVMCSWDAFSLVKPDYQNYCFKSGYDKKVPKWASWLHTGDSEPV